MPNPRDYLADLLESMRDVDLTTALDDEVVRVDPVESPSGEDVPNESGPIVYYPEDDPNYDPNDPIGDVPNESGPIFYDPNESGPVESPPGEDVPIDLDCWGTGGPREVDPDEGVVHGRPVDVTPAEDVYIEPEPEQEPGPEMSIQPVEEAPAVVEADDVAIA